MTSLRVDLRLPDAVRVGEPVSIELHLVNGSDEAIEVLVPGRPPAFDLIVETEGGTLVWRRLQGAPVAMVLGILRLEPGQQRIYEHTWDQRDTRGEPVSAGTYVVRGLVPLEDGGMESAPAPLRIEAV